jgi:hypothetical protein
MTSKRQIFIPLSLALVGLWAIFGSVPHFRSQGDQAIRKRMAFAPLGHTGLTEVMQVLAQIRKMAFSWDLSKQDEAGESIVDDGFTEFIESGVGFVTIAEMLVIYEMLYAMSFDSARKLAEAVLEKKPSSISTAVALGFMLERVYDRPREAGQVFLNVTDHAELPAWYKDLANRLITTGSSRNPDAANGGVAAANQKDFICDLLAKIQNKLQNQPSDQYPKLVERCQRISNTK